MSWVPASLGQREALKLPESHPVAYVNWQEKRRSDRRMAHRFLKEIREEHRRFLQAAYDEADGTPEVRVHRDAVIQASEISEVSEYEASAEFHMWVGTIDNVAEDFTTFTLTSKGVETVERERS
jgi:hypothetical protein